MKRSLGAAAMALVVAIGCRPALDGEGSPGASSIAGNLVASVPVTVMVHLPGLPGALAAPFVYAQAAEVITAANVVLDFTTPYPGESPFLSRTESDRVDLFVATSTAVTQAGADAANLVRIAHLQTRSDLEIVVPAKSKVASVADLAGKSILVDGILGDEAPLTAALVAAGLSADSVSFTYSEDLSTPYDPIGLFDGSYDAVLTHPWDGGVRAVQGFDQNGDAIGVKGLRSIAVSAAGADAPEGYSLWVDAAALETPDLLTALAATLIGIADGLASCRDSAAECAATLADSGLADQSQTTLEWAIDRFLASIYPSAVPILSLEGMSGTSDDKRVIDRAEGSWPASIDRLGSDWVAADGPPPLE